MPIKLDTEIEKIKQDGGYTDLQDLQEQNQYAHNNYIKFDLDLDLEDKNKYKQKITNLDNTTTNNNRVLTAFLKKR